jgi:squalene cyclase|tara:strand:+ start:3435 stop:3737 length:303 start_codon:yes stop_codon:yes gene_type:complete
MTHPLLDPLVSHLPATASSRLLIEQGSDYREISPQLNNELQWLCQPESIDADNQSGRWHLEQCGYAEWFKNTEEDDCVRMAGVLRLLLDTASALDEDEDE